MGVKIYLDDERPTPEGWIGVKTARECILTLTKHEGLVDELSLDHDLGEGPDCGTGYDVLLWLEEMVVLCDFPLPKIIRVHSANVSARIKMELAIKSIDRFRK